jgi:hypothetical protein
MLHLRSRHSTLLPLGALAIAMALSACGQNAQPSVNGSADLSVHMLGGVTPSQVSVTISGGALSAPKSVTLSPQGTTGNYGALISSLPVGSNYLFTATALDASNNLLYSGSASNVTIVANQITAVVITAQGNAPTAYSNQVPIIDSLVVSSTNVLPGQTVTATVKAHDNDATDTLTFAWSTSAPAGSLTGQTDTATTSQVTLTAPATQGDVTLTIQVKDNHGAAVSATVTIHVSSSNATGQAAVSVNFNNWPVVSDVHATPGFITLGQPLALSVKATDADGDTLSYVWSTGSNTCATGSFTSTGTSSTSFTLPTGAPDGYCQFNVAVSDGRGGSTTGTLAIVVGAPPSTTAPVIVTSSQSGAVVDAGSTVVLSVQASDPQGGALTFAWSTSTSSTPITLPASVDTSTTSQLTVTTPASTAGFFDIFVTVSNAAGSTVQHFSVRTVPVTTACTPPASTAWKFGVMSDTQWTTTDPAHQNPTTVAVSIIDQIDPQFIAAGVKFVIQVGDLADTGNDADETVRASAAQDLYNAGIGFFPMRGNHETYGTGNHFAIPVLQSLYPQTQGLSNTFGATNFSSPGNNAGDPPNMASELKGMTYSFDYNNARFVIVDPWVTPSVDVSQAGYDFGYSITQQQPWISSRLDKTTRGTDHAFVMSHQPLMAESHQDTMFQGYTNANPAMQNAFYASLNANNVKYFMAGHDHMNQHSIVASPDGLSNVHEIIGSSDSSKFYTPSAVSGANWFGQKVRETPIAQELYTVGYYIYTVDGANVTVDFYSDTHGAWLSDANYPMGAGNATYPINVTPNFTFAKKHTFGYSQNGSEFLVAQGASYPTTAFSYLGTTAQFLTGTNTSTVKDYISRPLTHAVDIGWAAGNCSTYGSIMSLWGTSDVGAAGDTVVLSMSYDPTLVTDAVLFSGTFGLATQNSSGNWTNAATTAPVYRAWQSTDTLGACGVDPNTHTAWAVVNHGGQFAIARF